MFKSIKIKKMVFIAKEFIKHDKILGKTVPVKIDSVSKTSMTYKFIVSYDTNKTVPFSVDKSFKSINAYGETVNYGRNIDYVHINIDAIYSIAKYQLRKDPEYFLKEVLGYIATRIHNGFTPSWKDFEYSA